MKNNFCVFLDLDNTIFDFSSSERFSLINTYNDLKCKIDDAMINRYCVINSSYWERLERGEIDRKDVLIGRFEEFHKEYNLSLDALKVEDLYESYLEKSVFFMPGARKLLNNIYQYYRLFIVSNGSKSIQDSRVKLAGIGKYFENIFISETIGFEKPSKEFFNIVINNIVGFDIINSIIVGDSLTSDIKGGINAGIKTCWYNYCNNAHFNKEIMPDFIIGNLEELPPLICDIICKKKELF